MQILKSLSRSAYFKNAATLVSGTALAQLISIVASLVLARIYNPGLYSILTIYMAVSGLLGSIASLQFHNVVVISQDEAEVRQAINVCVFSTLVFALLSLLFVLLFFNRFDTWFSNSTGKYWMLLTPLSVLFSGLNYTLSALASKRQRYKMLSANRIIAALLVPAVSITLGLLLHNETGLFAGLLVSQILPTVILARHFRKNNDFEINFSFPDIKKFISVHRNYPLFSLPADFINNLVNQLPVFMLTRYYNGVQNGLVGHYGRSTMLLGMPVYLVSAAVGEVFRQKASAEKDNPSVLRRTFIRTAGFLFLLSVVPFTIIILFGPDIFRLVLGNKWGEAGTMASALSIMFALRFTVSPLTYMYFIVKKQKEDFFIHIIMVLIGFLSFFLADKYYPGEYLKALWFYGISYSFIYLIYFIRSYQFCLQPTDRVTEG
jgi:O-antigen/teichoic acid export membrane protein